MQNSFYYIIFNYYNHMFDYTESRSNIFKIFITFRNEFIKIPNNFIENELFSQFKLEDIIIDFIINNIKDIINSNDFSIKIINNFKKNFIKHSILIEGIINNIIDNDNINNIKKKLTEINNIVLFEDNQKIIDIWDIIWEFSNISNRNIRDRIYTYINDNNEKINSFIRNFKNKYKDIIDTINKILESKPKKYKNYYGRI